MKKFMLLIAVVCFFVACSSSKKVQSVVYDIAPGVTGNARELVRVTNDPIPEYKPKISPDGKKIIFYTRDDNKVGLEKWSIIYVKIGEPGRIPLVGAYTSDPNWMPDSKGFLFQYLQPSKPIICRGNIDGSAGISYVSPSGMGEFDGSPQISADGKKILFDTRMGDAHQICMMDAAGINFTMLTRGTNPFWHPNGGSFIYENVVGQNIQIFMYDLKSGQSTQLTSGDHNNSFPAINSRGDKITFVSTRAKYSHIFISDISGSNIIQITQGNTMDAYPVFSKDDMIYFCSNAGGTVKKTTTTATFKPGFLTQRVNTVTESIQKQTALADYSDIWSVQIR